MATQTLDTVAAESAEAAVSGRSSVRPRTYNPRPASVPSQDSRRPCPPSRAGKVRRHIPPVSGHALEKLGHAIEYLTDEYIHESCRGGLHSDCVSAIQLLMLLNREIYFDCPIVEPLWKRMLGSVGHTFGAGVPRIDVK